MKPDLIPQRLLAIVLALTMLLSPGASAFAAVAAAADEAALTETSVAEAALTETDSVSGTAGEAAVQSAENTSFALSTEELEAAVKSGDLRTVLRYYLMLVGDYYLAHGLEANFPFFNADKYLALYPDVAELTGGDRAKALEHYLSVGIFEGRSCGTELDPAVTLIAAPELILSEELQTAAAALKEEGADAAEASNQLAGLQKAYIELLFKAEAAKSAAAGDSGSTSGSSEEEKKSKTFTMLLYFSPTDLENSYGSTIDLLSVMLGLYKTTDVNVVGVMGGSHTWQPKYLKELLVSEDGTTGSNGIFYIDREKLVSRIDEFIAEQEISYEELYGKVRNTEVAEALKDIFICEETMPLIGSVKSNSEMSMSDGTAVKELVKTAYDKFTADNYAISISGHGGGVSMGAPLSDGGILSLQSLAGALEESGIADKPLSALIFDCCLMGSAEGASLLSSYYEYMSASEEETLSNNFPYRELMIAIQKNVNSSELALNIVNTVFNGMKDNQTTETAAAYMFSTDAVFDSEKTAAAMSGLDEVAGGLAGFIDDSITEVDGDKYTDKKLLVNCLKLAAINCYDIGSGATVTGVRGVNYNYWDMNEFLTQLKRAIVDNRDAFSADTKSELDSLTAEGGAFDKAIAAADELSVHNYISKHRVFVSTDGESEELLPSSLQYFNFAAEGASIYFPYMNSYPTMGYDTEGTDALISGYVDSWKGHGFDNYLTLVQNYYEYIKSEDLTRIQMLAADLAGDPSVEEVSDGVYTYRDILQIEITDSSEGEKEQTVKVTPLDYTKLTGSEETRISDYSSGNALIDVMDTIDQMMLYLTKYMVLVNKETPEDESANKYVDVIIGSRFVPFDAVSPDDGTVNVLSEEINETDIYIAIGANVDDENSAAVVVEENLDTSYAGKIMTALGTDETVQYRVYAGDCTTEGELQSSESLTGVYHVFDKNTGYYLGTVSSGAEPAKIDSVSSISFNHKVYTNYSQEGIVGSDYSTYLEAIIPEGYEMKYDSVQFAASEYLKIQLGTAGEASTGNEPLNNGYLFVVNTSAAEDQMSHEIVVGKYDAGTETYQAVVSDGNYQCLNDFEKWIIDEPNDGNSGTGGTEPVAQSTVVEISGGTEVVSAAEDIEETEDMEKTGEAAEAAAEDTESTEPNETSVAEPAETPAEEVEESSAVGTAEVNPAEETVEETLTEEITEGSGSAAEETDSVEAAELTEESAAAPEAESAEESVPAAEAEPAEESGSAPEAEQEETVTAE